MRDAAERAGRLAALEAAAASAFSLVGVLSSGVATTTPPYGMEMVSLLCIVYMYNNTNGPQGRSHGRRRCSLCTICAVPVSAEAAGWLRVHQPLGGCRTNSSSSPSHGPHPQSASLRSLDAPDSAGDAAMLQMYLVSALRVPGPRQSAHAVRSNSVRSSFCLDCARGCLRSAYGACHTCVFRPAWPPQRLQAPPPPCSAAPAAALASPSAAARNAGLNWLQ